MYENIKLLRINTFGKKQIKTHAVPEYIRGDRHLFIDDGNDF